jgi:uncharacterized protein YndB with AHSA1/START domain
MSEHPQNETPRIEVTVAAPVDAVWKALRDHDTIRHWHGWDDPGLDAEIETIYFTNVEEDADRHTLTAQGGDVFEVDETDHGTRVRLTRAPIGSNPEWDAYYDDITEGWITFVHQLKFALERQPGITRRTLFLSGRSPTSAPVDVLGLTEVADRQPGTAYSATVAGQDLEGVVWFRSDYQLGLTVRGWSHDDSEGLLVIGHNPRAEGPTAGTAMVIISTYALPEVAFDGLERRWSAHWRDLYPPAG